MYDKYNTKMMSRRDHVDKRSSKYKKRSLKEHVLKSPGMFIGSCKEVKRQDWSCNVTDGKEPKIKFTYGEVIAPEGLIKLFYEVLQNATDNARKTRDCGEDAGVIRVDLTDDGWISVYNEGNSFPTGVHGEENMHIPQMVFTIERTSSNYDTEGDAVLGVNGVGIKLVTILSSEVRVDIGDRENKTRYRQSFKDNMSIISEPSLKYYKGDSYTKVSYLADFSRFGIRRGEHATSYTDETRSIIVKACIDASYSESINVYFNDTLLNYKKAQRYYSCLIDNPSVNTISWDSEGDGKSLISISVCIFDLPSNGFMLSLVNGTCVRDGGAHTESLYRAICKPLMAYFNKGSKRDKKFVITRKNIESHLGVIVRCRIVEPKFNSQSKTYMTEPEIEIEVPKSISQMLSWSFMNSLKYLLKLKEFNSLSSVKSRVVLSDKLSDAGYAGDSKNSHRAFLVLVEGDSAKDLAIRVFNDKDIYGVMPLKGKPLNLTKSTMKDILKNEEIKLIIDTLGIKIDREYMTEKDIKTLRYGGIIIFSDRDRDGEHISALLMNSIRELNTSLMKYPGFIRQFITPIVQLKKGKETMRFYTLRSYNDFQDKYDAKGWVPKYYKGLASYDPKIDVIDIIENPHFVSYTFDKLTEAYFDLAFSDSLADDRKLWLSQYEGEKNDKYLLRKDKTYSDFINYEYINFVDYALPRAIPSLVDSFKRTQRMVMYSAFQKFGQKNTAIKVANFGGYVSEICEYPHGETSLHDTIVNLAQSYTGSNNVPLLYDEGSFGSRINNKAGAARYINVKLNTLTRFIYRKEDDCILEFNRINEHTIEPKYYYPIVPMLLINGERGIAVGYSTTIPSYNPTEIISWIKIWLSKVRYQKDDKETDEEFPDLIPWYRGFTGSIYKKNKKIITEGVMEDRDYGIKVSELPIDMTVEDFRKKLDKLYAAGMIAEPSSKCDHCGSKKVKGRKIESSDMEVRIKFKIKGVYDLTLKQLGLISSNTYTNMTVLDRNFRPVIHKDIDTMLLDYCSIRYKAYQKRKKVLLDNMKQTIRNKELFYSFIQEILEGTLVINDRDKEELRVDMESKRYPFEFLKHPLSSLTRDRLRKIKKEISELVVDTERYKESTEEDIWEQELDELLQAYNKHATSK